MTLVIAVILVALIFEYINGFHDTANAIATSVATKVMTPGQAIVLASVCNLIGAMAGVAVAKTIGKDLVDAKFITSVTIMCGLLGAIAWNLFTWWIGLPSSSSHALIGGLCGAALASAHGHWDVILWSSGLWPKVVRPMFVAPVIGLLAGFAFMALLMVVFRGIRPRTANFMFGKAQLLSAAWMSFEHGRNDAQKTMGIIFLTLAAATNVGTLDQLPAGLHFLYQPESSAAVNHSLNRLGEMYRDGLGVPQDDKKAVQLFRNAADKKVAAAQMNLAAMVSEGRGTPRNQQVAEDLLRKAGTNRTTVSFLHSKPKNVGSNSADFAALTRERAEAGFSESQNQLAILYLEGRGVPASDEQAVIWLKRAAEQDNPNAMFNLGRLAETGRGVPKDAAAAARYYSAAADHEGIPLWIKLTCAITMAAGTAAGGWKIIRTMGKNVVKMQPVHGFAAQTIAAGVIGIATHFGIPLSTTHVISSSIMGVGATKRLNAVKWTVAERIVWAWVFTIPVAATLAYILVRCLQAASLK
jgi:phosphate/sulfate permease